MTTDRCPSCGSYQYRGPLPNREWGDGLTEDERKAVLAAYEEAAPEFHCNDPWHGKPASQL